MHIFLLSLFIFNSLFAVDYESQIQPIFNSSCGNCHLGNSSGGVNLSNYENTIESDILIAGDAESSSLYDRIVRDNSEAGDMPPGNAELTVEEIELIEFLEIAGFKSIETMIVDKEKRPPYFETIMAIASKE